MLEKIKNKKVLVVGLARSGKAAVKLLAAKGAREIVANDLNERTSLDLSYGERKGACIKLVTGGHPPGIVTGDLELVVKSPGVPYHLDIFKEVQSRGIPVISEIELAYPYIKSPVVGITGTNGKTTTTMLTAEMYREGGWGNSVAAGNIGLPLCEVAEKTGEGEMVVAELSSFQLGDIENFRPWVAAILNLTEDHMDYHGTMEDYVAAKSNILVNQTASDVAVFNADDRLVEPLAEKAAGQVVWFSRQKKVPGFCLFRGIVGLNWNGKFQEACPLEELSLKGEHNLENALAASAAAWAGGVDLEAVGRVLRNFKGVEHRLELVEEISGVTFINDSKATNPEAAVKAITSFSGPRILIAGGKDKGADYSFLAKYIKEEIKFLVVLGETAPRIIAAVGGVNFSAYREVGDLREAVQIAWENSSPGDVVLLSPACASWDMFEDYEQRGRMFKEAVFSLK